MESLTTETELENSLGYKRTSSKLTGMSAFRPKADILEVVGDVGL